MISTLDHLFRALVIVPFYGVPIGLTAWAIYLVAAKGAWIRALVGVGVGAGLCFFAFLLFLSRTYCESCADRPVTREEGAAILGYFAFGVVMLGLLWWTARAGWKPHNGSDPTPRT